MTEHILITLLACSKNNQLNLILTQFIHNISNQIKALLICQPGNHAKHHLLGIHFQSQLCLKSCLIFYLFLPESHCIVILSQELVCLRIVLLIVDAIYDTPKGIGPCTHETVQMFAVVWHLDLLCISLAYSRNCIRIYNASL